MGAQMEREKVTEDQLDDYASRLIVQLDRILYQKELEEISAISSGTRLIEMRNNARITYDQHRKRHSQRYPGR